MLLTHTYCLQMNLGRNEREKNGFTCQKDTNHEVRQDKLLKELLQRWETMRYELTAYHFLVAIAPDIYSIYLETTITRLA